MDTSIINNLMMRICNARQELIRKERTDPVPLEDILVQYEAYQDRDYVRNDISLFGLLTGFFEVWRQKGSNKLIFLIKIRNGEIYLTDNGKDECRRLNISPS